MRLLTCLLLPAVLLGGCAGPGRIGADADRGGPAGDARLRMADAAMAGGASDAARDLVRGVLRDRPTDAQALLRLAGTELAAGRTEEATRLYAAAVAADPTARAARMGLGRAKLEAGDPQGAEAVYRAAVAQGGEGQAPDATLLNALGVALDLQGRRAEAQAQYLQALAINPGHSGAAGNLALSRTLLARGEGAPRNEGVASAAPAEAPSTGRASRPRQGLARPAEAAPLPANTPIITPAARPAVATGPAAVEIAAAGLTGP